MARSFETESFGNASSLHVAGRRSRKLLSSLREELGLATGLEVTGWTFTSGATESLNTVLYTALVEGWQVWCSEIEHSAVLKFCAKRIPEAKRLPVRRSGELDLERLESALREVSPDTEVLLVLQTHNNETGFPLLRRRDIGRFQQMLAARPRVRVLWDAVQSVGKSDPQILKELLYTSHYCVVTGHKLGSLPGLGAVWRAAGAPLKPLLIGGTQESGLRAGTESLWSALAWFEALQEWKENGVFMRDEWMRLKDKLIASLKPLGRVRVLEASELSECLPNTLALVVDGMRSDLMLQRLDLDGVCVSSGSACQSGIAAASHVMQALGYSEAECTSFLRVSMPARFKETDLALFVDAMKRLVA